MNLSVTLDERADLRHLLFRRGWLISRKPLDEKMNGFPFYGHWNHREESGWHFMTHEDAHCHIHLDGERAYFLMGHCYNPFTMQWREERQLAHIAEAAGDEAESQSRIDELTGVFVLGWIEGGGRDLFPGGSVRDAIRLLWTDRGQLRDNLAHAVAGRPIRIGDDGFREGADRLQMVPQGDGMLSSRGSFAL